MTNHTTHISEGRCKHLNSSVSVSYAPEGNSRHVRKKKKFDYPCIFVRRRHCQDCGNSFGTVEIEKQYMDSLYESHSPKKIKENILEEITLWLNNKRMIGS